jgi:hypothetical protein
VASFKYITEVKSVLFEKGAARVYGYNASGDPIHINTDVNTGRAVLDSMAGDKSE